ncbi:hypothetical protein [Streptomyces sp. NPDC093970]|uniref:hypothetical protein n=1 Tax=Streptomyces sp. NPDC093970 TaxID=3155076 RepID=UPI0034126A47
MERRQAATTSAEGIRYRLTPLQSLPSVAPALVITVVQILFWLDGETTLPLIDTLLMWAVLLSVLLFTSRRLGVSLTPSAAIVYNLRRRTVPWSNVQAIHVESLLGSQTVVIYEAGGRCTRLRAPITGFLNRDRDFEEKFHSIGRWWMDHRGPDWVPVPPPEPWWHDQPAPGGNPYRPTS